jgi:hypothetical protein
MAWGGWNGVVVRAALGLVAAQIAACGDSTSETATFGGTGGQSEGSGTGSSGGSPTTPGPTEATGNATDSVKRTAAGRRPAGRSRTAARRGSCATWGRAWCRRGRASSRCARRSRRATARTASSATSTSRGCVCRRRPTRIVSTSRPRRCSSRSRASPGARGEGRVRRHSQCQIAETCEAGFCKVGWPHLDVAATTCRRTTSRRRSRWWRPRPRLHAGDRVQHYRNLTITSDGVLRAIRGDNGAKVWTNTDPAWRTNSTANPAIGDLDGDGFAEVVVEGEGKTCSPSRRRHPAVEVGRPSRAATGSGAVAIANIDGDGERRGGLRRGAVQLEGQAALRGLPGIGLNGQGPDLVHRGPGRTTAARS